MIVYFGIGESARLFVLIWAAFFASIVVLYEGIAAVDDIYVRAGRALGASEFEIFRRVIVPATVPQMFVALRVALGVCWATLVAAELIAAQRGLGCVHPGSGQLLPHRRHLRRHHPDRHLRAADGHRRPPRATASRQLAGAGGPMTETTNARISFDDVRVGFGAGKKRIEVIDGVSFDVRGRRVRQRARARRAAASRRCSTWRPGS